MDVLEFEELGDKQLKVGWRFSCILKLPWKPVLAAAGAIARAIHPLHRELVQRTRCSRKVFLGGSASRMTRVFAQT